MKKIRAKILYLPHYDRAAWGPLSYAHDTDSGFDVRACVPDDGVILAPMERARIPLGFCLQLEPGYGCTVRNRSGSGMKGIIMPNGIGTVDNGYTGEVSMLLLNASGAPYRIGRGAKIGQIVIEPVYRAEFEEVGSLDGFESTSRGAGGFGSTGE
ncbi:MAG: dUTP diphosphatase [Rickettsiales bacterium]|jgi:dUTP pyrophosphatase|nr:dUTP diphosphatase [Rickettsiales bacterium]